jgi:hypothetical protein
LEREYDRLSKGQPKREDRSVSGVSAAECDPVSRTVPTVFTGVSDPVGAGIVDSLARPDVGS